MNITFYGARGSLPVCSPEFMEFGGNTTCLVIGFDDSDHKIVIDAGTGIRNFGKDCMASQNGGAMMFCFSHFHWDHIQGLPFFAPAYSPDTHMIFMVLQQNDNNQDIKKILEGQMREEYFPVPLNKMGGNFYFTQQPGNEHDFMRTRIIGKKHTHPGGAFSFRFEKDERTIVVRTDAEYPEGISDEDVEFCQAADILVHDAQYTSEELEQRKGWGHSSYEQVIELARRAQVKHLVMTHHDPEHDDEFLNGQEKRCRLQFQNCTFAREGTSISAAQKPATCSTA